MIRRSTLFCIGLSVAVGAGLFSVGHEVKQQEAALARINRTILENQKAVHVLRAEWAYLNRPQRLQELSERHLQLEPVSLMQLVGFADLPLRRTAPESDADTLAASDHHKGNR